MTRPKPKSAPIEKLRRHRRDAPVTRAARYRRYATLIRKGQGETVARALCRDADQLRPQP